MPPIGSPAPHMDSPDPPRDSSPMANDQPGEPLSPLSAATAQLRATARLVSAQVAAIGTDEQTLLLGLATGIGAAAGVAVAAFYGFIDMVQGIVLRGALRLPVADWVLIPTFVALGIVACRSLVRWGARNSAGENIPDVMYRASVRGGVIALRPVLAKTLAAGIVIGTGGSVGAEGPVVVLGAGVASRLGRWLRASPNRLRTLVGCGAAAGLSSAFNAPIAGVIFGIEKITGTAGGMALGPYVVASILAATVSRSVFGSGPVLALPAEFAVRSPWELLLYVGLGVASGVVAVLYSRGVWKAQDLFARLPRPWMRVALGALLVGALDLGFRADLWGHGHQTLDLAILASRSGLFLLGLTAAKLLATAFTFGAGGTGGVFTPALYIGATLGGACGLGLSVAAPAWHVAPGALAMVGMAGLVAGATHAPLTAIMMVFEMTGDYGLILPLMLTSVIAYGISRRLYPESIYTEWLVRRGVVLTQGADAAVLSRISVGECCNRAPVSVRGNAGLAEILERTAGSRQMEFPVLAEDGRLAAMLSAEVLREAGGEDGALKGLVVASDLANPAFTALAEDDSLLTALRRLSAQDVETLPVVSHRDRAGLVGLVSRQDVMTAYEQALRAESH